MNPIPPIITPYPTSLFKDGVIRTAKNKGTLKKIY